MSTFRFIARLCAPFKLSLMGMVLTVMVIATVGIAQTYLLKMLIDTATQDAHFSLFYIACGFLGVQVAIVSGWFFFDLFLISFQNLRTHITHVVTSRLMKYDINFFAEMRGGAVGAKVRDISESSYQICRTIIDQYLFISIFIIVTFVMLFQINWIFALSLFIWTSFSLFFCIVSTQKIRQKSMLAAKADAHIAGKLVDMFTNMLTVKLFSAGHRERSDQQTDLTNFLTFQKAAIWKFTWLWFFFGIAFIVYMAVVFYCLISLYEINQITAGDLTFVIVMHYKIIDHIFNMGASFREFIGRWSTLTEALKMLDRPLTIQDKQDAYRMEKTDGHITFKDVSFGYPNTPTLFNKTNLNIPAGQKVGLVGYSGAGKTTFVNLLLRLYDVISGSIQIDGHNISKVTQDSLRHQIAMIPQDPTLFHRTIEENILYGNPDVTKEELLRATHQANAHDFIQKLPEGYNSLVGERGVKLSGGQRQRIAIARAFLKRAPLLILDEATSQLDSLTETHIQEALWNLMQDKTTLVIAHRLSTLLKMDRILVFDKGHIIEDGTHEQLLSQGGHYKKLWEAQVGGFLPE